MAVKIDKNTTESQVFLYFFPRFQFLDGLLRVLDQQVMI